MNFRLIKYNPSKPTDFNILFIYEEMSVEEILLKYISNESIYTS